MKKASKKEPYDQVDEHNTPTEPFLPVGPSLLLPPPDQRDFGPRDRTVNVPFQAYPDVRQPSPAYPYIQTPYSDIERYPPYPFLPSASPRAHSGGWPTNAAWSAGNTKNQRTRRRSFIPALVSLFFFCVQLLLIARFGVRFLELPPDILWVSVVTDVSEIFVLPFQALWLQIPSVDALPLANTEVYTLIAILIYGVLSRLLVGILKGILKSR
jgi:hypothetical protein